MKTHTAPTGRPVTPPAAGHHVTRDHVVTGTATQLANIVANHHTAGTLIAVTALRPVDTDRLQAVIRLRDNQNTRPTTRDTSPGEQPLTDIRRPRRTRRAAVTAVIGTLAGLVTAAAYLFGELVELITTHAGRILVVLALAGLVAAAVVGRGSGRRHCPGC